MLSGLMLTLPYSHQINLGVFALRKHILLQCWRQHRQRIPVILKQMQTRQSTAEAEQTTRSSEQKALKGEETSKHLRRIACDYIVCFLEINSALIEGTAEGVPVVNGQTLAEEQAGFEGTQHCS